MILVGGRNVGPVNRASQTNAGVLLISIVPVVLMIAWVLLSLIALRTRTNKEDLYIAQPHDAPGLVEEYVRFLREHGIEAEVEQSLRNREDAWRLLKMHTTFAKQASKESDYYAVLDQLKNKTARSKLDIDLSSLSLIQAYSSLIESSLALKSISLPRPVFCGIFPTGSFNAQAVSANGSALLLINEGLLMFVHRVIRLMSYDRQFYNIVHPALYAYDQDIQRVLADRETLDREEIATALAELVMYYLLFHDPMAAPKFRRQRSHQLNILLGKYVSTIEIFALSHEYAHVLLDHLDERNKAFARTPIGGVEFYAKSIEQEYAADSKAVDVVFSVLDNIIANSSMAETGIFAPMMEVTSFYTAPFLFLLMDELIDIIARQITAKQEICILSTHPDPRLRIENITRTYVHAAAPSWPKEPEKLKDYLRSALQPAQWCIDWFAEVQEIVAHKLRDQFA